MYAVNKSMAHSVRETNRSAAFAQLSQNSQNKQAVKESAGVEADPTLSIADLGRVVSVTIGYKVDAWETLSGTNAPESLFSAIRNAWAARDDI